MSSTHRTLQFLLSSLVLFWVYPLIYKLVYLLFQGLLQGIVSPSVINELVAGIVLILCLVFLGTLQGLLKFLSLRRYRRLNSILFLPLKGFSISDQAIYYIVPLIIYILPLFRRPYVNEIIAIKLIFFIIAMTALWLWLKLSKGLLGCYFLPEGLLITGFDVRLDLPIQPLQQNASGFYPYEKLKEYQLSDQVLIFKLPFDTASLVLSCKDAEISEIIEFLKLMKVPGTSNHN